MAGFVCLFVFYVFWLIANISKGIQAAWQRVKRGTRPHCCGVDAELALLLAAPWAAPCPLRGAVPHRSAVPGPGRRFMPSVGLSQRLVTSMHQSQRATVLARQAGCHGACSSYLFIISFFSSSLIPLIGDSLHFLFYLLLLHLPIFFSLLSYFLWVFFPVRFLQHFWSWKYIKDASSLSWTLKPTASEGLQGWGGFTSLLSEEDGVGLACPSPPRTGVKQEQSGGDCSSEQKWHQDLPPTHGHHCSAHWWQHKCFKGNLKISKALLFDKRIWERLWVIEKAPSNRGALAVSSRGKPWWPSEATWEQWHRFPLGASSTCQLGTGWLQELAAGASAPGQHACPCPLPGIYQATKLSLSIESKC